MNGTDAEVCPLCGSGGATLFHRDRFRRYLHCAVCDLVFVPAAERPDAAAEKARYDLHQNDPNDDGYRRHLARLCDPMTGQWTCGAEGLDFGCGPGGGALMRLFSERGCTMRGYDPFYAPDETVWARTWDFITMSEVIEHLHHPARELDRVFGALRPGGQLGVLTERRPPLPAFAQWHYITDITHVAFYSEATMDWIARRWGAIRVAYGPDVSVFVDQAPQRRRLHDLA